MTENTTPPDSLLARDPLALAMFAAWVNLPVDKLPEAMHAHTCEQTAAAWGRVASAARTALLGPDGLDWLESASLAGADVLNAALRARISELEGQIESLEDKLLWA